MLRVSDFDYDFAEERVATEPLAERSRARLLHVKRGQDSYADRAFADLPDLLAEGDVLVVNHSKVLPARFYAQKTSGGSVEGIYLADPRPVEGVKVWLKGRLKAGDEILLKSGPRVRLLSREGKEALLSLSQKEFLSYLNAFGELPLPPYILERRRTHSLSPEDAEFYQSIFSDRLRSPSLVSAAAPTASLHFDEVLLERLRKKGIEIREISLAVGAGTFAPMETEKVDDFAIHSEEVSIDPLVWERLAQDRSEGRKIVAVGTTSLRALETAARLENFEARFISSLFVHPPFSFRMVDKLITNFHWPRSSLLVLVATFLEPGQAAIEHRWRRAYEHALSQEYRLFSYGDGMLIE